MSIEQLTEFDRPARRPELSVVPSPSPAKPADFRLAAIGAAIGFVLVGGVVLAAGLIANIGVGSSFGLALWLGFWGGGGFGFMAAGGVEPKRRHPAER